MVSPRHGGSGRTHNNEFTVGQWDFLSIHPLFSSVITYFICPTYLLNCGSILDTGIYTAENGVCGIYSYEIII